ncbi:MAG: serine/threonine protein kinase, partial [Chloroflexota bacterium]|nr:serine/threonine protein kinase [Chloroflexota bacterium]
MERVLDKRYKIVESIGAGGSSQVYRAQDTVLNREVAIKVLDAAAAADPALRKMFVKEARSLAALSHPGIVAVYDVGEVDGLPFIVMEHLPGGSLKQRLERSGPMAPVDAVSHAVDIANGLAFAHSKGIIHADLKPSNILFDASDHAKVADFGIARTPQEDADTPQLFATAMYVAPERVEGKQATP